MRGTNGCHVYIRRNEFIASKCVEYGSRAHTKHIASRRERPGRVARVARVPRERASARRRASCDSCRDSVARGVADARRERGAIDPSQQDAPNRAHLRPPRRRSRARRGRGMRAPNRARRAISRVWRRRTPCARRGELTCVWVNSVRARWRWARSLESGQDVSRARVGCRRRAVGITRWQSNARRRS